MVSRVRWLSLVTAWAATPDGRAALARFSVGARRFLAIVAAMARHCDGSTGRNIAVGNTRLASEACCCERLITTTRRILIEAGWLHKSAEGTSSRSGRFNRPPIVHLTMPRPTSLMAGGPVINHGTDGVDNPAPSTYGEGRTCDLLRSSHLTEKSLVDTVVCKPKARRRALRNTASLNTTEERRRWHRAYTLADDLIARTVGLEGARGPVAAALKFSALNLETWTAAKIKAALDIWGKSHRDPAGNVRQMDWPNHITRPGAFLAYRLQHLDVEPEKPVQPYIPEPPAPKTGQGRRSAWAAIKTELNQLNRTRTDRYMLRERAAGLLSCPVCGSGRLEHGICQQCRQITRADMPTTVTSPNSTTRAATISLGRISA